MRQKVGTVKRLYEKEIAPRLKELRPRMEVGNIGGFSDGRKNYEIPYVVADSERSRSKKVFLSAGIHGDEVAGVYAVLDFLKNEAHHYLNHYSFVALPCLNPSGFERNTRHNHSQLDINKDFRHRSKTEEARLVKRFLRKLEKRYVFCLNAHEDPTDKEARGFTLEDNPTEFYLYLVSPSRRLGHTIMKRLERDGFPVCSWERIYDDRADRGIVWWAGSHDPEYKDNNGLENHFLEYTHHSIAPETPTCWPLEQRIEAHKSTIRLALESSRHFWKRYL